MGKQVLGFVVCAGVLLTGCVHVRPARVCAEWRWIGIKSSSTPLCPAPAAGWKAEQLFGVPGERQGILRGKGQQRIPEYTPRQTGVPQQLQITPAELDAATNAADVLDRFCLYEPIRTAGKPAKPPFPEDHHPGLDRLDRDCAAISPSSGAVDLSHASMPEMSAQFMSQAGRPSVLNISNEGGVRLAFLDTEPTNSRFPPQLPTGLDDLQPLATSLHGYTLAHIARQLVCNGNDLGHCAAQITTQLAMPFRRFDPDRPSLNAIDLKHGGIIGSQDTLAKAITSEVDTWVKDSAAPPHLVLNLSLGWDPLQIDGLGKESRKTLDVGTQAVLDALHYASSLDVLVLAAAGNRKECSYQDGPLLPAAWEDGAPGDEAARSPSAPRLVYAVGGVDSYGRPLSNARFHSMPARTACGENGVVTTSDPEITTWLYTGSSVATAVVSSTAAVVWDSFPGLTRAELMKLITDSGNALGFDADFGFTDSPPKVRRVSLCAAVLHACEDQGTPGGSCPVQADQCPAWVGQPATFPKWIDHTVGRWCHPWTVPQPDDLPCPPCNPRP